MTLVAVHDRKSLVIGLPLGGGSVGSATGASGSLVVTLIYLLLRADPLFRAEFHAGIRQQVWFTN